MYSFSLLFKWFFKYIFYIKSFGFVGIPSYICRDMCLFFLLWSALYILSMYYNDDLWRVFYFQVLSHLTASTVRKSSAPPPIASHMWCPTFGTPTTPILGPVGSSSDPLEMTCCRISLCRSPFSSLTLVSGCHWLWSVVVIVKWWVAVTDFSEWLSSLSGTWLSPTLVSGCHC